MCNSVARRGHPLAMDIVIYDNNLNHIFLQLVESCGRRVRGAIFLAEMVACCPQVVSKLES